MKVVYDHQVFSAQRYGGISRYFVELAGRLAMKPSCEVRVLALAHVNAYVPSLPSQVVTGFHLRQLPYTHRFRQRTNNAITRVALRLASPDVVHETYYAPVRVAPRGIPTVVTIYDMIHERFPKYFPDAAAVSSRKACAVERAAHIVCISESTRRDLIELLHVDPRRVSVVHLGSSMSLTSFPTSDSARDRPYLLHVGDRGLYKNFSALLQAMALLPQSIKSLRLVLFGGGPITPSERCEIAQLGLRADLIEQISGDDAVLADLYVHAAALVYPSLYEGFGIPLIEAMACGCPVVCGNNSSLAEVAGDAAQLCDPSSPESLAHAIACVIESPERATELRERGFLQSAAFSWDRCAEETYSIYDGVTG
ncbi:MAG: glycosyltransferase family 4 protein [Gemmatimonadaceae bacterium]